jgi:hypothetical protein
MPPRRCWLDVCAYIAGLGLITANATTPYILGFFDLSQTAVDPRCLIDNAQPRAATSARPDSRTLASTRRPLAPIQGVAHA